MTYDIIKTDNYLIIIGDTFIWEGDEPYFVAEKLVDGGYDVIQIDNVNDWDASTQFKILAHLPLNGNILENIPLLPPLQDDEYEKSISESCNKSISNILMIGYNKAKRKYKYTEEDLRTIFSKAWLIRERYEGPDRHGWENSYPSNWKDMDYEERQEWFFQQELKSLTKYPIGFECEMEWYNPKTNQSSYSLPEITGLNDNDGCYMKPITTTNSQGQTILLGKYIY